MNEADQWSLAFARQADADLLAWELLDENPEAIATECHKLLFLQMACEKFAKASLIQAGTPLDSIQASHKYTAKRLPMLIRDEILATNRRIRKLDDFLTSVRHLSNVIELLNPAVDRGGQRPDNCEYPWQSGTKVLSPLDWSFTPVGLCLVPSGRAFLKLLCGSITRLLKKLEPQP